MIQNSFLSYWVFCKNKKGGWVTFCTASQKWFYDYCVKLYTLLSYINLKICLLFGDDSKSILTTFNDNCLKISTLLLKLYKSKDLYTFLMMIKKIILELSFFVKKKRGRGFKCSTISQKLYDYCIKLHTQDEGRNIRWWRSCVLILKAQI